MVRILAKLTFDLTERAQSKFSYLNITGLRKQERKYGFNM